MKNDFGKNPDLGNNKAPIYVIDLFLGIYCFDVAFSIKCWLFFQVRINMCPLKDPRIHNRTVEIFHLELVWAVIDVFQIHVLLRESLTVLQVDVDWLNLAKVLFLVNNLLLFELSILVVQRYYDIGVRDVGLSQVGLIHLFQLVPLLTLLLHIHRSNNLQDT